MNDIPHLLLVCPRAEALGKLVGLPVAVTIVHRPGGDRELAESVALNVVDADFTRVDDLLRAARSVHARRPIDAVLGLTELSLYPVSVVAAELGVRGNSPATLRLAQDKAAMRRRLADKGVSSAAYRVCADLAEAAEFAHQCPDGMILKPVGGNGGTGVFLVREPAELSAGWSWTTTATAGWTWQDAVGESRQVLAEEYLTGRELSVEILSAAGEHRVLAVTGKHTTGSPYFTETGHDLPAILSPAEHDLLVDTVVDALDAIGYAWGPSHTEVMLSPHGDRATIVEINARQGGDRIWELVHLTTGWDMIAGAVLALTHGVLPSGVAPSAGGAAVRFVTPRPGRVVAVEGLAEALEVPGVLRVSELCRPGDMVTPLSDSWGRAGYVLAAGPDTTAAAAAADRAASLLVIRTVEQSPQPTGEEADDPQRG